MARPKLPELEANVSGWLADRKPTIPLIEAGKGQFPRVRGQREEIKRWLEIIDIVTAIDAGRPIDWPSLPDAPTVLEKKLIVALIMRRQASLHALATLWKSSFSALCPRYITASDP